MNEDSVIRQLPARAARTSAAERERGRLAQIRQLYAKLHELLLREGGDPDTRPEGRVDEISGLFRDKATLEEKLGVARSTPPASASGAARLFLYVVALP